MVSHHPYTWKILIGNLSGVTRLWKTFGSVKLIKVLCLSLATRLSLLALVDSPPLVSSALS